jgi:hypothetical protein
MPIKAINIGLLLSFGVILFGFVGDRGGIQSIGFIAAGLILVMFHRDIATEQYRIDKASQNKFLKTYLFANESVERNSIVVFLVGVGFMIGGGLTAVALLP